MRISGSFRVPGKIVLFATGRFAWVGGSCAEAHGSADGGRFASRQVILVANGRRVAKRWRSICVRCVVHEKLDWMGMEIIVPPLAGCEEG